MVDKKSKYRKNAATSSGRKSRSLSPEQEKMVAGQVWALAEPLCQAEGIELVYVEYRKEPRGRTLRIYLDKPGGVTIDDCVNVSRQMGDILDVSLKDNGAYHLEVSSPGPERPLCKASDFERFRGNMVNIRLSQPIDGKDRLRGILNGMDNGTVTIQIGDKTVAIPFADIVRARLLDSDGENRC